MGTLFPGDRIGAVTHSRVMGPKELTSGTWQTYSFIS